MQRLSAPAMFALLGLLLVAGCAGTTGGSATGGQAGQRPSTSALTVGPPAYPSYVALGDSYTAAPFVPVTDLANGCLRSSGNYPSLVAKALKIKHFHDVSCSAARSRDIEGRQRTAGSFRAPPQLAAVRRTTAFVTLGIGGNDDGLFARMLGGCRDRGCRLTAQVPALQRSIGHVRAAVTRNLQAIRHAAPHAKVLLVGYPQLAPDRGTCKRLPPLGPADLRVVVQINRELNSALRAAAHSAGAGFVDVYSASRGHDICARVPWVNGIHTDTRAAAALHPFAREQQAVAHLVEHLAAH
ncbi:MAG: SGNH/GDSL hydrolase family protein [Actinomycetota bacterium]|nr:SGNH/GDSL hydrolase family protein [Actinomycetota bacterium]